MIARSNFGTSFLYLLLLLRPTSATLYGAMQADGDTLPHTCPPASHLADFILQPTPPTEALAKLFGQFAKAKTAERIRRAYFEEVLEAVVQKCNTSQASSSSLQGAASFLATLHSLSQGDKGDALATVYIEDCALQVIIAMLRLAQQAMPKRSPEELEALVSIMQEATTLLDHHQSCAGAQRTALPRRLYAYHAFALWLLDRHAEARAVGETILALCTTRNDIEDTYYEGSIHFIILASYLQEENLPAAKQVYHRYAETLMPSSAKINELLLKMTRAIKAAAEPSSPDYAAYAHQEEMLSYHLKQQLSMELEVVIDPQASEALFEAKEKQVALHLAQGEGIAAINLLQEMLLLPLAPHQQRSILARLQEITSSAARFFLAQEASLSQSKEKIMALEEKAKKLRHDYVEKNLLYEHLLVEAAQRGKEQRSANLRAFAYQERCEEERSWHTLLRKNFTQLAKENRSLRANYSGACQHIAALEMRIHYGMKENKTLLAQRQALEKLIQSNNQKHKNLEQEHLALQKIEREEEQNNTELYQTLCVTTAFPLNLEKEKRALQQGCLALQQAYDEQEVQNALLRARLNEAEGRNIARQEADDVLQLMYDDRMKAEAAQRKINEELVQTLQEANACEVALRAKYDALRGTQARTPYAPTPDQATAREAKLQQRCHNLGEAVSIQKERHGSLAQAQQEAEGREASLQKEVDTLTAAQALQKEQHMALSKKLKETQQHYARLQADAELQQGSKAPFQVLSVTTVLAALTSLLAKSKKNASLRKRRQTTSSTQQARPIPAG